MRIIGIELGTWSVKAVEMESRWRRVDVLEFHEVRLPLQIQDPVETYRQAIQQLLARLPSHPEKIVTALPHNQTAVRFLRMPVKKRKQVEQMFRFELEDSIPFKLDDAIIEHQVGSTKEGSLVFTAVSPKKNIQSHLQWLRNLGIEIDWLAFEGMGLINTALSTYAAQEEDQKPSGPVLLLDIGHTKTNVAIIHEERLEFFRTVTWGGAQINHSLAINLGVPLEQAEEIKCKQLNLTEEGGEQTEDTDAAVKQAFSSFIADLNHCLVAYRNNTQKEISVVHITGGTSRLKGIEAFIEDSLGMPTMKLRPFEVLELKEELKNSADQYRFSEAWGRAMVFSRKAPVLFNFRQAEMAKQTSLSEVTTILKNPNVIKLGQYVAALAIILFLHVTVASYLADAELGKANEELRKVFKDTFRSVSMKQQATLIENPSELKKFIDQKNNELEQKLKMMSKTKTSMLKMMAAVSSSFPKTVRVDVNDLYIGDKSFSIDGVVYDNANLAIVTENLTKITWLHDITLKQEGQRFTYNGKVQVK